MKSHAYSIVNWFASCLLVSPISLMAMPQQITAPLATTIVTAGQAAAPPTGPSQAKQLLARSREAISRGDLQLAEQLVSQAERLNVRYDQLFGGLEDTPAKVRQSLAAARRNTSRPPDGSGTPNDRRLEMMTNDVRVRAKTFLDKGRLSLQQGDITGAIGWRQKAINTGARFAPGEYSPATLAEELRRVGVPQSQLGVQATASQSPLASRPDDVARDRRWSPEAPPNNGPRPGAQPFSNNTINSPYDLRSSNSPLIETSGRNSSFGGANPPADRSQPPNSTYGTQPRRLPTAQRPPNPIHQAQRNEALQLMSQSRLAMDQGNAAAAKMLIERAVRLQVPDSAFAPGDPRPEHLLLEINSRLNRQFPVAPASYNDAVVNGPQQPPGNQYPVRQGVYNPENDYSRNIPANAQVAPTPNSPELRQIPRNDSNRGQPFAGPNQPIAGQDGMRLFQQGMKALEQLDREAAMKLFAEAWKYEKQLDPLTRQRLRDKLTLLRAATPRSPSDGPSNPLEEVNSQQTLLTQKIFREISREQSAAEKMRETDPRGSLARLESLRKRVEAEELDPPSKKQMLTLVDRSLSEAQRYIDMHLADIELDERNAAVTQSVEQKQLEKLDRQDKLAELVERFNQLLDENRFPEAEVLARQANELDPDNEVVRVMYRTSKLAQRVNEQVSIREMKEQGFYDQMTAVEYSSRGFDDRIPMQFEDITRWEQLSKSRGAWMNEQRSRLTPPELEIQKALETKVEARFENRPLAEVVDALGRMAGVNVYLDPQGLHAEGVTTDEPVSINLSQPISLRSALNLILDPLRLSYVIQNEVLRITSSQTRDSDVYPRVYNVADLVIPIPNFIPSYNIGLPGAIRAAHEALGYGQSFSPSQSVPLTLAANEGNGAATNASVLAQMGSTGMLPSVTPRSPQPFGYNPGGMGGASQADFDTLIDLITRTIAPTTWDAVGGPGSIEGFPTNLSLVVSQTQDVHEQIADLLDQLRRLQDLQVTIEVRFITLNDRFFERIGIDFDFEVDDNSGQAPGQPPLIPDDEGPSIAFGLDPNGAPTIDYDYAFTQGSFGSSVPQFGGFDASTAANFGFAILSDIEVFFLLQAATGDNRTNVLQAPKVTLFNGQTGFVSDTSQRPFVTSVIPVVGDFAAAHQPVVVVLSEGTSLSVQAVVSPDRRFVRLTLIPFFSSIGEVSTFTFNGKRTSDSGTIAEDPANEGGAVTNNELNVIEGTTVQLPTFNFTTVSTTVSVPDGGTVLLGGIKRLSEGRNERGVPFMNKLPYINRLFKNVGIGRDTQSLMMMVTPRIIIQEEEEFLQTGYDSSQQ